MKIAVLGAGSWGTALARLLARKGLSVVLWARRDNLAQEIIIRRENPIYLPGIRLPETLKVTAHMDQALSGVEVIVLVVPSHGLRETLRIARDMIPKGLRAVVSATKGIETETLKRMSQVIEEEVPDLAARVGVLSGPSFATEVAQEVPTAVTVAAHLPEVAGLLQELFHTPFFRVYTTNDVVGVELAGALKNVMAIAAGIAEGLGFGTNTRAALITRGLAEISRLGLALGANPLTFAGLAGLGDLVLTCTGTLSRNRQVGLRLGRGESLEAILASMKMVAEGVRTTKAAYRLAKAQAVELPITEKVYEILYQGKAPAQAVRELLSREPKPEMPHYMETM
ncbi:MAG TPA: NAD(P)H-dependent glycerol-3-phosphate dehydrogenase [Thermodesulfatator sp.]|nr:NAD(P)H-dependent glycerol-3-phosphate dehydrogenase [Thermodesulfatator sp.]